MDDEMLAILINANPGMPIDQVISNFNTGIKNLAGKKTVYLGIGKPPKKTVGRPGSPVTTVTGPATESILVAQEVYLKFWKEPATRAKVMARLAKMGRSNLGEAGGYELWKDRVDEAAEIYDNGKGYKITPFELMNLSAVKATPENLPQRQVQPLERSTIDNFVDSIYLSNKGEMASIKEKDKWFKEFEALNTGTVTTTKKVKNDKGILENVSTTTRGFNQDAAQAKIEADLKKNNPLEYQRRKAFEFADEFSKVMSGGM